MTVGIGLLALALLAPRMTEKGAEMDEGAVLAYSALVLEGAVPHRDFETFYGPGNLWIVAGAFEVFGTSITTERAVGLVYRLLIVFSVVSLGWRLAGAVPGALAGVIAASIAAREVVWAYPTYGAIGLGLLSLALALFGAGRRPGGARQALLVAAGAAAGAAVLVRFDFAPAVVLSALPLALFVPRSDRWWYAGGFVAVAGLYVPHLVMVGAERIARVAEDLAATGEGRSLPIPRPWADPVYLLYPAALATALFVAVGTLLVARKRQVLEPRVLLSLGLFVVCLFPYALSRADIFHLRPVALVPLSLLPAFAVFSVRTLSSERRVQIGSTVLVTLGATWLLATRGDIQLRRPVEPDRIENAGRTFYVSDRSLAKAVTAVVHEADRRSRSGDTLYVGPVDLRRMNYGATYIYFLLPQLRPASYYMEMNPLTANREGSGLADELRRADWLVLTSEWDEWEEPNASVRFGPTDPNEVIRDFFCLRFRAGSYRLYERCDRRSAAV